MADVTLRATSDSLSFDERVARAEAALLALRGPLTAAVFEVSRHLDAALAGWATASEPSRVRSAALDIAHNLKGLAGATGSADAAALSHAIYDQLLRLVAPGAGELAAIRATVQQLQAQLTQAISERGT